MSDFLIPDDATITGWIADWGIDRIGGLERYLACRGAIWAQQTCRQSLLERAQDELDTVGLLFKLEAVREVVRLYGLDH
mgnify:CR=1 FL=1